MYIFAISFIKESSKCFFRVVYRSRAWCYPEHIRNFQGFVAITVCLVLPVHWNFEYLNVIRVNLILDYSLFIIEIMISIHIPDFNQPSNIHSKRSPFYACPYFELRNSFHSSPWIWKDYFNTEYKNQSICHNIYLHSTIKYKQDESIWPP